MIVCKFLSANTPATIDIANFQNSGSAEVWQLTSAKVITRLSNVGLSGSSLTLSLPPQSVTLLIVPRSSSAPRAPVNLRVM